MREADGHACNSGGAVVSGALSDDWRTAEAQLSAFSQSGHTGAIVLEVADPEPETNVPDLKAERMRRTISGMARKLHALVIELTPREWSILAAADPGGLETDPTELVRDMDFEPANDAEAAAICMTWAYNEMIDPFEPMAV